MTADEYYQSVSDLRNLWRSEQHQACMVCGESLSWLEIHEICPRSLAQRSWGHACNYLLVDQGCHQRMGSEEFPFAVQLAIKMQRDPGNYDLGTWLQIIGRHAPTQDDVDLALESIVIPALNPKHYPIF